MLENLLIGVISTFGLAWAGWVSITIVKNYNNSQDVKDLKESFKEMEDRVNKSLNDMNLRQDNFIKAEIQELKTLFDRNGG